MAHKKGSSEDSVGRAYALFYCSASKQEIEAELPVLRRCVRTPSQLELSLIEGMDDLKSAEKLIALAQEAEQDGMNYVLQATYPGGTNESAADEAVTILNQASQSPLYQLENSFAGRVVYEENGEYFFRD